MQIGSSQCRAAPRYVSLRFRTIDASPSGVAVRAETHVRGDTRMSAVKYDLTVIGSGPSGQRAAVAASKMKKRVAVVEARSVVGGVCVNTGTIPSKTMREAVLHLSGYNYRSVYGMNYKVKERITMADLAFRVQHVI